MFSCVHQGNLQITPVPSKLTKYAQKTLYTKTPLSRGLIGKTFPDTEKKIKKTRNQTQILTGFAYWQPSNKLDCDESLHLHTKLDTTDIISLLNFVLSNNYFVYNESVYKQIHGCAMGSPVSPVVANLCMEAIEEMAINTTPVPPKVWKRYVDDSFCIIKRNAVDSFHNTLNSIDQHISFTIEEENNNQMAFLDALVTRKDNDLIIEVYRKPTHTDRYLDFFSHHDKRHKTSTAETLLHRATNLPSTKQGKEKELIHVIDALRSNNYPQNVISNILKKKSSTQRTNPIPTPEELVCMFFKWVTLHSPISPIMQSSPILMAFLSL